MAKGGKLVAGLVVIGFVGVLFVLYAADRLLKARAQTRRLRAMSTRLDAASARAEEQQEHRQEAAQASAALTSFMPAIKQPPLTVPDGKRRGAARLKPGRERKGAKGAQDHGSAARPGRRSGRTGEHPIRPTDPAPRP